jgi:hypothetical protein
MTVQKAFNKVSTRLSKTEQTPFALGAVFMGNIGGETSGQNQEEVV